MRRPLTFALAASVVLTSVTAVVAAPRAATPALRAGAATATLDVPPGTSLAGYGSWARRLPFPDVFGRYPHAFWFRPHDGVVGAADAPAVRALVLESGGTRLVWTTVDLIAVDRAFTSAVERAVDTVIAAPATVMVSASHTHSGPGAFIDSGLMGLVAVDRLDASVRDVLVREVVAAVRRAAAAVAPARLGSIVVPGPAITRGRLSHQPDRDLAVVKVVSASGAPIAIVWNYAIHGTMLGPKNMSLSGDVMGVASRRLERDLGVPALFVNGAVGDVSPERHGRAAVLEVGGELADAVRSAWTKIDALDDRVRLKTRTARVDLPAPSLSLRNCTRRWVPRMISLPLGDAWPQDATLTAAAIGELAVVTIPGELQSRLAQQMKRDTARPWPRLVVAGVTNDYLGYFVTADDWDRVSYVTCASVYGASAGERLRTTATELLRRLGDDQRRERDSQR